MSSERPFFLSIIIPAFNEESRLPKTLGLLADHCARYPFEWEIVAVVDPSTDRTLAKAQEVACRKAGITVVENPVRRGKGYAVRTGARRARGEIVFLMDADLSVPPAHIDDFLDHFASNPRTGVVVASRRHPASVIEIRQPWVRGRIEALFNWGARLSCASRLRDTQCGFKALRRDAAKAVFARQTFDGFACDLEILLLAERMGFRVDELPVRWVNPVDSRVRLFQDTMAMFTDLLRVRAVVRRSLELQPFAREAE